MLSYLILSYLMLSYFTLLNRYHIVYFPFNIFLIPNFFKFQFILIEINLLVILIFSKIFVSLSSLSLLNFQFICQFIYLFNLFFRRVCYLSWRRWLTEHHKHCGLTGRYHIFYTVSFWIRKGHVLSCQIKCDRTMSYDIIW